MKIAIEASDILFSVLETEAEQHGRSVSEETVAVLEDWLGTPKEILALANDLQLMRSELQQVQEETSDFAAEVTRRINLLLHLDK